MKPLDVSVTWIYPSPSTNPTKKAKKDEGIELYSSLSNLKALFPFFKALLWITPIVGSLDEKLTCKIYTTEKKIAVKHKLIIIVIFFDSTTSVPIQGIALIRLVIQNYPTGGS